jgi:MFS family permease
LRHRDYTLLWLAMISEGFGGQMTAVAVGWQVYSIHHSPFELGLIGLAEFLPLPILALPAGQLADRVSRRLLFLLSLIGLAGVTLGLLVVSLSGAHQLWPFLALGFGTGVSIAIGAPPGRALPAMVVPFDLISSAMALRSIAFQAATITGPALGGFLFTISPNVVYASATVMIGIGIVATLMVGEPARTERAPGDDVKGFAALVAGIHFIRKTPVIMGSITLDLFAVLFGGAVALAPVFARTILHVGPIGLGILRSGPAIGALLAGIWIARKPLERHAGRRLLIVVGAFGLCMVVFGLSHSFWLSLLALAVSGAVDMVSMNIRATAVVVATPDELRGRVLAVEMVFISASNELGAFESGAAAAAFGTVTSVVAGGLLTMGLAAVWPKVFPALSRIDRIEDARPKPVVSAA